VHVKRESGGKRDGIVEIVIGAIRGSYELTLGAVPGRWIFCWLACD